MSALDDSPTKLVDAQALERYICQFIAELKGVPSTAIRADLDFDRLGLSSADTLRLAGELEERLGVEVSPTILFEATSIADVAAQLACLSP